MLVFMPARSPTIPRQGIDQIGFCETHAPVWAFDPAFIGLTPAQVTQLATLTAAARAAFEAAESARLASMAATTAYHDALASMRTHAADLVGLIRALAQSTHDTEVYAAAQISPPRERRPAPTPTTPTEIDATLNSDGSITLTWRSHNATPSTGAYFQVERKLGGETGYRVIGGAPTRTFRDTTIPAGVGAAAYIITGFRGNRRGESSQSFVVQFGGGASGAPIRMAA
jgi:hypothetical protein